MSTYIPTGLWNVQKLLQTTVETAYGAKKTASPSFTNYGLRTYLQENTKAATERYRKEGSRDIYKGLKYGELYSFVVRSGLIDTAALRRGTELPAGAGTSEESQNFVYSQLRDLSGALVEHYKFYLGARCDQTEVEVSDGIITMSQNYICSEILAWNSAHGLTSPTFASVPTTDAWSSITSGLNPLSIGGTNFDTPRAKIRVELHLEAIKPNGATKITMLWPTNRDIQFEFDTWLKDDTHFNAVKNLTNYSTVDYILNSTGPKKFGMTDVQFEEHETVQQARDNKHQLERLKGFAKSLVVTA